MERPNLPERSGHDDERRSFGPPEERLAPGEIDLTGAIPQISDLIDVIGDAIVEAGPDGEVPEWGARAIARLLANMQQAASTAMHQFAVTGRADLEQLGLELSDVWRTPNLPPLVNEAINRLGTYLLDIARKERVSTEAAYSDGTQALIAEHGPAYAAFLRLPDITEENAPDLFLDACAGHYASLDELIEDIVTSLELRQLLEEASLDYFADIDPAKVLSMARETYDIVHYGKRYYCFYK